MGQVGRPAVQVDRQGVRAGVVQLRIIRRHAEGMGDGRKVAQTLIDTLGMLQEKTEGRLETDERQLLDQALTALRFRFVQTAPRP